MAAKKKTVLVTVSPSTSFVARVGDKDVHFVPGDTYEIPAADYKKLSGLLMKSGK